MSIFCKIAVGTYGSWIFSIKPLLFRFIYETRRNLGPMLRGICSDENLDTVLHLPWISLTYITYEISVPLIFVLLYKGHLYFVTLLLPFPEIVVSPCHFSFVHRVISNFQLTPTDKNTKCWYIYCRTIYSTPMLRTVRSK